MAREAELHWPGKGRLSLSDDMRDIQHRMPEVFSATRDAERAGAEFLLTDLDVAFTLLRSAAISRDNLSSDRDRQIAHHAYETVRAHLKTCPPDFPHRQRIENRLQALDAELARLREPP